MNKVIRNIANIGMSVLLALTFVACSEKEEVDEYANWSARNQHFIDSIANVCEKNEDGNWEKIVAYNLNDSVEALHPNNNHYIYVHKMLTGTGTNNPLFTDSIRIHYEGRIIPTTSYPAGYVFKKSYSSNTLNTDTDVPELMGTSSQVIGKITATLNMVEGDRWKVYVPYYLGYGASGSSNLSVPGYSALIYDIYLAKIYRLKTDTNHNWY